MEREEGKVRRREGKGENKAGEGKEDRRKERR